MNKRIVSGEWRMEIHLLSRFANRKGDETSSEDKAQVVVPAFWSSLSQEQKIRRRNADRSNEYSAVASATAAPASAGAHLSAFHRGSGLGDQTPPPSFSSALPGMRRRRAFPLACQSRYSDASRGPVVMPVGAASRSRPGAGCKAARGHHTRPALQPAGRSAPNYRARFGTICN